MRYLQVVEDHGRYMASLLETAVPAPRAGEVLIRVAASGVNRADLSQIAGAYPPPPGESDILGLEVSGTDADSGARVCALLAGGGLAAIQVAKRCGARVVATTRTAAKLGALEAAGADLAIDASRGDFAA